jgi:amino acid transporter
MLSLQTLLRLVVSYRCLVALVAIAALITYKKKWKWLYKNWLTTVDPKKIGVMYIIVALIMLLRGVGDAALMRLQQATLALVTPWHF